VRVETKPHASINNDTTARIKEDERRDNTRNRYKMNENKNGENS
jgi:hypothetical protein